MLENSEADRAGTAGSHTISKSKTKFVARLQDMDSSEAMEMKVEKFMGTELESLLSSNVAEMQKELLLKLTTHVNCNLAIFLSKLVHHSLSIRYVSMYC